MQEFCVPTDYAVYFFVINPSANQARVTKRVLKGHKGYDASTSMDLNVARKFYKQLVEAN
jgi:hypothetical protein